MGRIDDDIILKIGLELGNVKDNFADLGKEYKNLNAESEKTDKLIGELVNTYITQSKKINEAIKTNVSAVANEAKAIDTAQKAVKKAFDGTNKAINNSKIKDFTKQVEEVFAKLGNGNFKIDSKDLEGLSKKLLTTKSDVEALQVVVGFFEDKLKTTSKVSTDSIEVLNQKLKETKLNIQENEKYLKDLDKTISKTAPGTSQVELIKEREASKKALEEEKVALIDYQLQIKNATKQNKSLSAELRNVKNEIIRLELNGKRGSKAYNELREKARQLQSQIKQTNAELSRSVSNTRGLDQLMGSITGLVGMFTAVQGASALFGNSSEDLQKTLVKLNAVIALLSGLQATQNELVKKGTILNKAYTWTYRQLSIAVDSTTKATKRFSAAMKLTGIGLLVTLVATLATNWEKVSKAIGITNDATLRNQKVNRKANELYGEQIAKMTLLIKRIREGIDSERLRTEALRQWNEAQENTNKQFRTYLKLENEIRANGPKYIQYLKTKAKAEAAYLTSIELTKKMLEKSTELDFGEQGYLEAITGFFEKMWVKGVGLVNSDITFKDEISEEDRLTILGLPTEKEARVALSKYSNRVYEIVLDMWRKQAGANLMQKLFETTSAEADVLADELGLKIVKKGDLEKQKRILEHYLKIMSELIKKEENVRIGILENARDREIALLKQALEEDKKKLFEEINNLELTEEKKKKLRAKFNQIYNDETGSAYEQLRKNIADIDKKYDQQIEETRLMALQAIDMTYGRMSEAQIVQIKQGWEQIREELRNQIKLTNNEFKKLELESLILQTTQAEAKELRDFILHKNLERLDLERELADSVLKIYKNNTKKLIEDESFHQATSLALQVEYFRKRLDIIKQGLTDEQGLYLDQLKESLNNSTNPEEMARIANEMRTAFGDDTANEILKTVSALNDVETALTDIADSQDSETQRMVKNFAKMISSTEGFATAIGRAFGLAGKELEDFSSSVATAMSSIWSSMKSLYESEIRIRENRVKNIEEKIDELEKQVEKEKELHEKGFANTYEANAKELEHLQEHKAREEEELERAQAKRAQMQKMELIMQSMEQIGNLVTATTNILSWTSSIPFGGQILAAGLIAAMWATFAASKVMAVNAVGKYRDGVKKGPLRLDGPTHEQGGFSVVNSRTGQSVAEFENDEDVYVLNRQQQKNYGYLMKAIVQDAKGEKKIDNSLSDIFGGKTARDTRNVIKSVNITTAQYKEKHTQSRKADESASILKQMQRDFKEDRANRIEAWETPKYYYVKVGRIIKKYEKDVDI